ncbi:UNVERIFIED_CONTAM: hypothetical protein HDU68_008956 [Siphonaria sp. JEL0065]|nr:hypothetical protein HDU68_008956 [Siphonaria sp. JEL0065]
MKKLSLLASVIATAIPVYSIALKPEWKEARDEVVELLKRDSLETLEAASLLERDKLKTVEAPGLLERDGNSNTISTLLTDCQYTIMLKITSYFENPTASFYDQFKACQTYPDSQGITAGLYPFTTCSGSALQVCKAYTTLYTQPQNFCTKYLTVLANGTETGPLRDAVHEKQCNSNGTTPFIPKGLETFCVDWASTSKSDPRFNKAQMIVQSAGFFESIAKIAVEYNIKSPLVLSQLYDISVQSGPSAASVLAVAATSGAGGSPASTPAIREDRWLYSLLNQRRQYLISFCGPFKDSVARVDAVARLLNRNNSKEEILDHLNFKGNSISISFAADGGEEEEGWSHKFTC